MFSNKRFFLKSVFKKTVLKKSFFKKKHFYLVNIWASWCVPCRDEHSFLVNLSNEKKLEIIGLNYKDNTVNAKSFLMEFVIRDEYL